MPADTWFLCSKPDQGWPTSKPRIQASMSLIITRVVSMIRSDDLPVVKGACDSNLWQAVSGSCPYLLQHASPEHDGVRRKDCD